MFQQPSAGGERVSIPDLLGSLVLIWVREVREGIATPYGEKEAVAVDLHVLDGAHGGEKFENSLIFQGGLIGSLRSAAGGEPVLGRISQGTAKPGQSPPFILLPYSEQDAAVATGYIQRMPKSFQAPVAEAPAPAPAAPAAAPLVDLSALPAEVVDLLKQSGAVSA